MGSSLKICLVAEGVADCYPRMGSTKEWDTAAAHAIVNESGGSLMQYNRNGTYVNLLYNKPDVSSHWFVVKSG
jgi:3'(2'), 5'-bisphosphate nucleotidase